MNKFNIYTFLTTDNNLVVIATINLIKAQEVMTDKFYRPINLIKIFDLLQCSVYTPTGYELEQGYAVLQSTI